MCRDYLESNPECCDYIRSERSSTLRLDIVNRCSYLDRQLTAAGGEENDAVPLWTSPLYFACC